jgi:predicted MPP superfamily phosphohydrolase
MNRIISFLWDLWCCVSIIGLWPRFIEPKLLKTNHLNLPLPEYEKISGLKIVHFSDLHLPKRPSKSFLKKIITKIHNSQPDIIFFTGDFLNHSSLFDEEVLYNFLKSLKAPLGVFACLGNHDYASYISRNKEGNYDVIINNDTHFITKSIKHLFSKKTNTPLITQEAKNCPPHKKLLDLLKNAGVTLLHNETYQVTYHDQKINITGLGDYWAGKCDPGQAFKNYDLSSPGLILSHNPDTLKFLKNCPGNIIFSGHTHGGQVNLPFVFKTFIGLENKTFKHGLFESANKKLFITKGVGSHQKFRFFCPPEIAVITL